MILMALVTLLGCGRFHYDRDSGPGHRADGSSVGEDARAADAGASTDIDASEPEAIRCCGACTCTEAVCQFECTCSTCDIRCPYGSTCMAVCATGSCTLDCQLGAVCALECGPSNLCAGSGPGPASLGCNEGLCSR
jgi:hypothetical protein